MEDKDLKIQKLENEIDKLKDSLLDVTIQLNYSREKELLEFLYELYNNINDELNLGNKSKLTKITMLKSLKEYIEEFSKNNKIILR